MKKILAFAITAALAVGFIVSCGEDDDDDAVATGPMSCLVTQSETVGTTVINMSFCAEGTVPETERAEFKTDCEAERSATNNDAMGGTYSAALCAGIATGASGCTFTDEGFTGTLWFTGETWETASKKELCDEMSGTITTKS